MRLRGIEFGPVWGASGVQGFFGEGYRHHRYQKMLGGLDFTGMTFVAKTMTIRERAGNTPLAPDFRPLDFKPRSVYVNARSFIQGAALNAVGLSNPGAKALLERGLWQKRQEPFFLSFMSVGATPAERLDELKEFVELLWSYLPDFRGKVGLQLNFSCPNTEHHPKNLILEISHALSVAGELKMPLVPKVNLNFAPAAAAQVADHPDCDAVCVTNTIPWDELPAADRLRLFGRADSPLADWGGGGVSGSYLLPGLLKWLVDYSANRGSRPLNAGGGILEEIDAVSVFSSAPRGSSVFLGTAAMLRWWRVARIIQRVHWAASRTDAVGAPVRAM